MIRHLTRLASAMVLALCFGLLSVPAHAAPTVFVTILPQKQFVEKIAGDLVDTKVLVMPGANPHMYEPTPKQMAALSKAAAYFAIGVNLETSWLPRIKSMNGAMQIFHAEKGVKKIPMVAHHHEEEDEHHADAAHEEDHHEEHEHGAILDPHIWLDPVRVQTIARNTCKGLITIDPAHEAEYTANLDSFLDELKGLDSKIAALLSPLPRDSRSFMVFHPSWGYFAQRYNLKQVPIEASGSEPGPRQLAEIITHGKETGIRVVFVQPQLSRKSAQLIASQLDARVVPLDPLAEDWENNIMSAAKAFDEALH